MGQGRTRLKQAKGLALALSGAAAHQGQGGSTRRWLPLLHETAGLETSHVQRAAVFHAFFPLVRLLPEPPGSLSF